jgi:hypothetical protein
VVDGDAVPPVRAVHVRAAAGVDVAHLGEEDGPMVRPVPAARCDELPGMDHFVQERLLDLGRGAELEERLRERNAAHGPSPAVGALPRA